MRGPILVTAGGTGGHMFPALALARELRGRGEPVAMVTDRRGARFMPEDLEAHLVRAGSPTGSLPRRLAGICALVAGIFDAWRVVRRLKPRAAASFGGYASVPAAIAARLAGRPLLLHEQNAVFGRANRLLARFAEVIALSFEATSAVPERGRARLVVTGNPVRPGFEADPAGYRAPGPNEPIRILVIGGSQGARIFSDVVPAAVALLPAELSRRLRIEQQCRPEDLARVADAYKAHGIAAEVAGFFTDMPAHLARAHLVISRAGASSLTEIMAMGRPSILVPYAAAADDHQRANAEALARAGGAVRMLQASFTPVALAAELTALAAAPERLEAMATAALATFRRDAAGRLADAVLALVPATGESP
jgi:UDP-N-acetylglucosamine--N-acetylmuramyl-(pentapeptide) pyrophosphoryl-undecaprenol N-acetylglucosamine transferase